ncbi:ribosome small subunit-dependent GTPase A [Gracilimonas sp.]|uniref:ribosome small subunit-dependent GTPase A n=1 Tax=Gracilimonas sp. TaxID=1974203 RepID=UPI0032F0512D
MTFEELGYNKAVNALINFNEPDYELGRVIIEHRDRYSVQTPNNTFQAEITGGLRYTAESKSDLPAVGDWVKLSVFDDKSAVIHEIFPRFSILERQAVGKFGEKQIIATNVDVAFIMQAVGHDFNLNRLERYLTVCTASSIKPIIVLSKIDLIGREEINQLTKSIKARIKDILVYPISNQTLSGYEKLKKTIISGNTYCILGSSGVGKSSLTNNLLQKQKMDVNSVSESTSKGKHTTSHRELIVLPEGGVLVDTPGMRELGITGGSEGIEHTFGKISILAKNCSFNDCKHMEEPGCAVLEALESGELDQASYENYHKLKREQAHFSSTIAERRAKDKKQGKLYKRIQEEKRKRR